jgi:hypothetical protein
LRNLLPLAEIVFRESEAVGSNDCAVLERDVVAKHAALTDNRMGVREEVAAGSNPRIEHDVREDCCMRSKTNARTDHDIGPDMRPLSDFCGRIDDRGRMDSG